MKDNDLDDAVKGIIAHFKSIESDEVKPNSFDFVEVKSILKDTVLAQHNDEVEQLEAEIEDLQIAIQDNGPQNYAEEYLFEEFKERLTAHRGYKPYDIVLLF